MTLCIRGVGAQGPLRYHLLPPPFGLVLLQAEDPPCVAYPLRHVGTLGRVPIGESGRRAEARIKGSKVKGQSSAISKGSTLFTG